jgi:hypothetical protein
MASTGSGQPTTPVDKRDDAFARVHAERLGSRLADTLRVRDAVWSDDVGDAVVDDDA